MEHKIPIKPMIAKQYLKKKSNNAKKVMPLHWCIEGLIEFAEEKAWLILNQKNVEKREQMGVEKELLEAAIYYLSKQIKK